MRYIFLDLETTGLEAGADQITEAAWITDDQFGRPVVRQFFVEHDRLPNRWVLENTDYLTRIALAPKTPLQDVLVALHEDCARVPGIPAYLVGACIAFDDRHLRSAYKRLWGEAEPPYHYHVIDIEAMAFGLLGLSDMPSLKVLREKLGIAGENPAAHTALADAQEVRLIFDAIRDKGVPHD